jgi:hypothetical protein
MLASKQCSANFITSNWKGTYDYRQFSEARRRSKKCAFAVPLTANPRRLTPYAAIAAPPCSAAAEKQKQCRDSLDRRPIASRHHESWSRLKTGKLSRAGAMGNRRQFRCAWSICSSKSARTSSEACPWHPLVNCLSYNQLFLHFQANPAIVTGKPVARPLRIPRRSYSYVPAAEGRLVGSVRGHSIARDTRGVAQCPE